MGKPTDGTYAGTVNWGQEPFPALKNPKFCIVTFTGITRTPLGESLGAPAAPNRNFCPEREDCTGWHEDSYGFHLDIDPTFGFLYLSFTDPVVEVPGVFNFSSLSGSCFAGENEFIDPELYCYVGGRMSITWMEHYGPDSVWFLMDAFGLDYSDPTMLEQIPQLLHKSTTRFADIKDGTCIRIKINKDWGVFLPVIHWSYDPVTHDLDVELWFTRDMDHASTPLPTDFTFCNDYEDEILAVSCAWQGSNILELHFTVPVIPTEDSWLNYTKGLYPISPLVGDDYTDFNHMYFP